MAINVWQGPFQKFKTISNVVWRGSSFGQSNADVIIGVNSPAADYLADGPNNYTIDLSAQNAEGDQQAPLTIATTGPVSLPFPQIAAGAEFLYTSEYTPYTPIINDAVLWWSASTVAGTYDIDFESYTDDTSAFDPSAQALSLSGQVQTLDSGISNPIGWNFAYNWDGLVLLYETSASPTTKNLYIQSVGPLGGGTQPVVVETVPLATVDSVFYTPYTSDTGVFTLAQTATVDGSPGLEFTPINLPSGTDAPVVTLGTPSFQAFSKPAQLGSDPFAITSFNILSGGGEYFEFIGWQDTAPGSTLQGITTELVRSDLLTDLTMSGFQSYTASGTGQTTPEHWQVVDVGNTAVLVYSLDGVVKFEEFDGDIPEAAYTVQDQGGVTPSDFDSVTAMDNTRFEMTFHAEDPATGANNEYAVIYDTSLPNNYTIQVLYYANQYVGTPFNDTFIYGPGVNIINGGGGTDKFVATNFSSSQVSITVDAQGNTVFSDGMGDVDTLERISSIVLSDKTIVLYPSSTPYFPTITNLDGGGVVESGVPVKPFTSQYTAVTIADLNIGATDTLTITQDGPGTLSGAGLTATATAGVYTLTGSAAAITSELDALIFTPINNVPGTTVTTNLTLSNSSSAGTVSNDANNHDLPETISYIVNGPHVINGDPNGNATITATYFPEIDIINAYGYNNKIYTNDGDDIIYAGAGNAQVYIGTGNVTTYLQGYFDNVTGPNGYPNNAGNETVSGSAGDTYVNLGNGNNTVSLGGSSNFIRLGSGNNTVNAGLDNAIVVLGNGKDSVTLSGYNNSVTAGDGSDTVLGSAGSTTVTLGNGNNTVKTGGYGNTINLGGGNNRVNAGQNSTVHFGAGTGTDIVTLAGYSNVVTGGNEAVSISGSVGTTSVTLGNGTDVVLTGGFNNIINLGSGNDTVNAGSSFAIVQVGGGNDKITLGGYSNTVTAGDGADTVSGSAGYTSVTLGNGNDTVSTGGYNNTINLGNGNDTVTTGLGNATVTLGSGTDTVTLAGDNNSVTLNGSKATVSGGQGVDSVVVNGGNDALSFSGWGSQVSLNGTTIASIADLGNSLRINVGSATQTDTVSGFGTTDPNAILDLKNGVGGYDSTQAIVNALHSDGHGGTLLSLGTTGSIDFTGTSLSQLHASNFAIG